MRRAVLGLCELTGNMVRPWNEAGYDCYIIDLQHPAGVHKGDDGITRVGADILTWLPPLVDYAAVFAFPPCTDLAVSGARWFSDKGIGALCHALSLVERCREICEWSQAPYFIENPVSTISSYWRKPDHTFDPCDYGDPYTKKTCLWTGGGVHYAA